MPFPEKTALGRNCSIPAAEVRRPSPNICDRMKVEEGDPATLAPGTGKVLEHEGERIAAFRDAQGNLTRCSAVCPHLGCIVAWNEAERTWDCPCHGSRFLATGELLAGPAEKGLEPLS
jgi:Rieske Fe-S protein